MSVQAHFARQREKRGQNNRYSKSFWFTLPFPSVFFYTFATVSSAESLRVARERCLYWEDVYKRLSFMFKTSQTLTYRND